MGSGHTYGHQGFQYRILETGEHSDKEENLIHYFFPSIFQGLFSIQQYL